MKKRAVYYTLAALILVMILTVLGWRYYIKTLEKNEWGDQSTKKKYEHHYVIIPDDTDSVLWQDIYQSAKDAANEQDAYVELFGNWAVADYDPLSYINIAIAAKVDGIILKPDGTAKMRAAINAAEEAGIPVITVLDDDTSSARKSFVGINSYQMGTTYGRQVLTCVNDSTENIAVLLNYGDGGKDLIFKELKATVLEGLSEEQRSRVTIHPLTITSSSTFDTEEVIRELISDEETRPDILVCMNETDSERAYHAMVDYNQVGSIDIIGYYQSETILNAIEKGTVPMAVTLNTQQIGQRSIDALEEYYSMGYASNYYSVDLNIITSQNVNLFRSEESGR